MNIPITSKRYLEISVALVACTVTAMAHTHFVQQAGSASGSVIYFALLWGLAGIAIGSVAADIKTCIPMGFCCGLLIGAVGYGIGLFLAPFIWVFALYIWWIFSWCALGILRAMILSSSASRGFWRGLIAGLMSAFPFTMGMIMWSFPGDSPAMEQFFGWWWITFAIAYLILLIGSEKGVTNQLPGIPLDQHA